MTDVFIRGAATTAFGKLEGVGVLELLGQAAQSALTDAGLRPADIDGVLCGYATTLPHIMLATVFAERMGISPRYAHAMSLGGATGVGMVMLARELVAAGRCSHVLVVAGENRATGQSRNDSIQTLAQVGDPDYEVPNGGSVPAYYALLASAYMAATGISSEDLAELAVLMRRHAASHPQAHLRAPVTVADVLDSKPVAEPLRLLDCCPISDGGAAVVISAVPGDDARVAITGAGQAHMHQHLTALDDVLDTGSRRAAHAAISEAGVTIADIDYLGIYDSFTITLAMLLEEIGFAARGQSGALARGHVFGPTGRLPLNTHGGLLSFGHSGVAGGLAHLVEAYRQLALKAGDRQLPTARRCALVHADGGVLSSHVSMVLRART